MINKKEMIQHIIQPDDKLLVSKVLDQVSLCIKSYKSKNTEFLDPYQVNLCKGILSQIKDIQYVFFGGYEEAERKVLYFFPLFFEYLNEDIPVKLLKIKSKNKFSATLTHRDYLGSLLSLGVKRESIGDIVVHSDFAYVFVLESILDYILMELSKIKRDTIEVKECSFEEFSFSEDRIKEISSTVSSLRLDAVASAGFGISRTKMCDYIKGGKVKVNWDTIQNVSFEINEGDVISLRGYGRIKVKNVYGTTKKGRIQLTINKYL